MPIVTERQIPESHLRGHGWLAAHQTAAHSTTTPTAAIPMRSTADIRSSDSEVCATGWAWSGS